jgi:AraC-like DNA-binding protein
MDEPCIQGLLERIRATRGTLSILQWAREQAIDARTLERRFVARMGMTPKQFARIERFKHSYGRFGGRGVRSDLDRRTYLEPYYDESHFSREFRHYLGTSPVKWRADASRFKTTIADHLLAGELESASGRSVHV